MHPREINLNNEDEIVKIFNSMKWSERQEILKLLSKEKAAKIKNILYKHVYNRNDAGWGEEMDEMLQQGYPQYMNSKHSNIETPKQYIQKGKKRKIFIICEEEF